MFTCDSVRARIAGPNKTTSPAYRTIITNNFVVVSLLLDSPPVAAPTPFPPFLHEPNRLNAPPDGCGGWFRELLPEPCKGRCFGAASRIVELPPGGHLRALTASATHLRAEPAVPACVTLPASRKKRRTRHARDARAQKHRPHPSPLALAPPPMPRASGRWRVSGVEVGKEKSWFAQRRRGKQRRREEGFAAKPLEFPGLAAGCTVSLIDEACGAAGLLCVSASLRVSARNPFFSYGEELR